jgi:Flp pilus assembly pilin Flp
MKKLSKSFPLVARSDEGQAVIEYMLALLVAVSVVIIIAKGFKKSLFVVWSGMTVSIAAACPGCPPNPKYRLK